MAVWVVSWLARRLCTGTVFLRCQSRIDSAVEHRQQLVLPPWQALGGDLLLHSRLAGPHTAQLTRALPGLQRVRQAQNGRMQQQLEALTHPLVATE